MHSIDDKGTDSATQLKRVCWKRQAHSACNEFVMADTETQCRMIDGTTEQVDTIEEKLNQNKDYIQF